jgi:EmrB/QacA subfamily drug resistance transporter
MTTATTSRDRWIALAVLCMGSLMIVLDSTIVNVALPSIRSDLHFSQTSLAWVVNGYLLSFGGFLLLGGRLGDLYGPRRLFMSGIVLFSLASLTCGLAGSQAVLVCARVVQGFGGAVVSAVSLSLMMGLFTEPADRAKAMGFFGFVAAGGGSLGVLLGGVLTDALSWHWIFLVNVPIGAAVCAVATRVLPPDQRTQDNPRLDVAGAVTVTTALMLAVYAIANANTAGWISVQTLGLLGAAAVLIAAFVVIELRAAAPLVPLPMLRRGNLPVANLIGVLWAAAMFAWFFLSALYLQLVLGYRPLDVGLAFLPANLIMGAFSLGLSAKLVMRYGIRRPLAGGLFLAAIGLGLLARAPVGGSYATDVLPSMILLGFGAGLGLAILASVAASRTNHLLAAGAGHLAALTSGYHAAFIIGAVFALLAAALGAVKLHSPAPAPAPAHEPHPCTGECGLAEA